MPFPSFISGLIDGLPSFPMPPFPLPGLPEEYSKLLNGDVSDWVHPQDLVIKGIAQGKTAEQMFNYVRDGIKYSPDPEEHFQADIETNQRKVGDCEDHAFLLAAMLASQGIPNSIRVAMVPSAKQMHMYNVVEGREVDTTVKSNTFHITEMPPHTTLKTVQVFPPA